MVETVWVIVTYAYVYICIHMSMCVCMHDCTHMCMHMSAYVCVCVRVHLYVYERIRKYLQTSIDWPTVNHRGGIPKRVVKALPKYRGAIFGRAHMYSFLN